MGGLPEGKEIPESDERATADLRASERWLIPDRGSFRVARRPESGRLSCPQGWCQGVVPKGWCQRPQHGLLAGLLALSG
jgi:hypothetical protein